MSKLKLINGPPSKLDGILKKIREDYPTEMERSRAVVKIGDEFTREFGKSIPHHLSPFAQHVAGMV